MDGEIVAKGALAGLQPSISAYTAASPQCDWISDNSVSTLLKCHRTTIQDMRWLLAGRICKDEKQS